MTKTRILASLPYVLVGLLLIIIIFSGGREIDHHIGTVETGIMELGPRGIFAFIGIFVLATSLFLPESMLCIIAGALFGVGRAFPAVVMGSLLAAAIQFALARKLLRLRIQRRLSAKPSLAAIQLAVLHDEIRLQLLLRLTPLNPATISYLLGSAGVRFWGFLLSSLALIPNLLIEVYFGHAGKHAARLWAGGNLQALLLHDLLFFGGFVFCVVLVVMVSRMARKALAQAVAETKVGTGDFGIGQASI
jgi:uncharacterized membrane protein YdjX (TVP38/TMEM64 family)